jgi:protein-L-isoaspartate O-methyltransferase
MYNTHVAVTYMRQAYQNAASFVPKLATKVMQWLDPQKDDVILDVGCGGKYPHP